MRKIWLLVLIVTLIGCSYNKKKTLKKELEMLYSSTIEFLLRNNQQMVDCLWIRFV